MHAADSRRVRALLRAHPNIERGRGFKVCVARDTSSWQHETSHQRAASASAFVVLWERASTAPPAERSARACDARVDARRACTRRMPQPRQPSTRTSPMLSNMSASLSRPSCWLGAALGKAAAAAAAPPAPWLAAAPRDLSGDTPFEGPLERLASGRARLLLRRPPAPVLARERLGPEALAPSFSSHPR